jgi:putative AdoMet-dependent methyltransferase
MNKGETPSRPLWYFDEFQDFGWSDAEEIEGYDERLGTQPAQERERLRRLGVAENHTLIDFGCGTGALALEAAKLCREVVAVDVSVAMLGYVRAKAERLQLHNLTCVHGGFLSYEHPREPVDFVATQHALHHLPDYWKVQALVRMADILKPGGVLFVSDIVFSFSPSEADDFLGRFLEGHPLRELFAHDIREEYITYTWLFEAMLERVGLEIREASQSKQMYAEYVCVRQS